MKPWCRLEDNIKINLKGTGSEDMNSIQFPQDVIKWWALVNTVMNIRIISRPSERR
jgi:hypothetical protein